MTYHIGRKSGIEDNIRLIARDQIERALGELRDPSLQRHEIVHRVRKRCKKLRGLIRLVRPAFNDYKKENAIFRDAMRDLSAVRDARAMLNTYDKLIDRFSRQVQAETLRAVREHLLAEHNAIVRRDIESESLEDFLHVMREARDRVEGWQIEGHGFEAIEGGLRQTYSRARSALSEALAEPDAEHLHAWRKRVKYHWYHTLLLRRIWPEMMGVRGDALDHLSDLLGDDHDLSVLRQAILQNPDLPETPVQVVTGLIDRRRARLQSRAWPPGKRLFAEKPGSFVTRCDAYWSIWQDNGH